MIHHTQRLLIAALVFHLSTAVIPTSLYGQQPAIKTLKTWIDSLHDCDLVANVQTGEPNKPLNSFAEEVYLSKDEDVCIAKLSSVKNGKKFPTDVFGLIGHQQLSVNCSEVEDGTSGGVVRFAKDPRSLEINKFLNMFALRHLFLRSRAYGAEFFPIIQSRTNWESHDDGLNRVFRATLGETGAVTITVDKKNPDWPLLIGYTEKNSIDGENSNTQLELRFSEPTHFDGIARDLPGKVVASIKFTSQDSSVFASTEIVKLVFVKKRIKKIQTWSDVLTEMPDGLEVNVTYLKDLKFEWQKNEIVRSSDHRKLSEIE
ncbi:MAG: hypothetical protein U0930_02575 [Pirellulales bacterium]